MKRILFIAYLAGLLLPALPVMAKDAKWWDKGWTGRKEFTIETGAAGAGIQDTVENAVVLVRLHQGNFAFDMVREDGADIRAVSADGETELPVQVERIDTLLYEAYVWVRIPEIKGDGQTPFWLYFGNPEPPAPEGNATSIFDESTVLAYHFSQTSGSPPRDSSPAGNNAETAATTSSGSLIAGGLRLLGADPIVIPASESLAWTQGQEFSVSVWVKPTVVAPQAILLSRTQDGNAWRLGVDNGIPFVEITDGGTTKRTAPGELRAETSWKQFVVVSEGSKTTLFVDGVEYGSIDAGVPAMNTPLSLGGDAVGAAGAYGRFVGEADELRLQNKALPLPAIAFAAINQSASENAAKVLVAGEDEGGGGGGHNATLEHIMLFGDIARNMMFDGWIAVGICVVMMIAGWWVGIKKFIVLGKIEKGNAEFKRQWQKVAQDLTVLDRHTPGANNSLGGGEKALRLMRDSPLFHVYHIGAEEIRRRLTGPNKANGLSARSIQAIRAALDAGLVHERHRLNKGMVLLTIGIAGGPYVGLLGTVVGVMITFALVAKYGEVDVNAIAPGIASALLATTMGLVVAIPALFIYSFLNNQAKESLSSMQVFIDEFVAKVAEFYPTPSEAAAPPIRQIRTPEQAVREEEKAGSFATENKQPS